MYSDSVIHAARGWWVVDGGVSVYGRLLCALLCTGLAFAIATVQASAANPPTTIVLATNLSAAFSADAPDARLTEEALPHIGCILGRLHWPYSLRVVPWRRTYQDVKNNRIDGFFSPLFPCSN